MKTLLKIAIVGVLAFSLSSCDEDDPSTETITKEKDYKGIHYYQYYVAVYDQRENLKSYRRLYTYYYSPDGKMVIVPDSTVPGPQNLSSEGEALPAAAPPAGGNAALSLQSPGAYLINNTGSNAIVVLDKLTKLIGATIPVSSYMPALTASPDGKLVVVAQNLSTGGQLLVVDVASNRINRTVPLPTNANVASLNFPPDSQTLYVVNNGHSTAESGIFVLDATTWTLRTTVRALNPAGNLTKSAISPNGQLIFLKAGINEIAIFDTLTNTWAGLVSVGNAQLMGFVMAFSPDGHEVYVDSTLGVAVIDVATATVVANIATGSTSLARRLSVSPGAKVAVALYTDRIARIDLVSRKVAGTVLIQEAGNFFDWGFIAPR